MLLETQALLEVLNFCLAKESYEEETVLVMGLPTDHLVAVVAVSDPYSVVLIAGLAGSYEAAAAGLGK